MIKIRILKKEGKKFPYYYAHNCPKEHGLYRYKRTFYIFRYAVVISLWKNI